jgi:hypothetical protein
VRTGAGSTLAGYVGMIESGVVAGWAADTAVPDGVVDILIYVDGKRVARVACDIFREDLLRSGRFGQGRHGFRYEFSPPLPAALQLRVCVRFAATGAVLRDASKTLGEAPLRPILVTAPGRSGTTFLMGRLAARPEICIAEALPYEVRLLAYWSTVFSTLTGAPNFERSVHPDFLEGDGYHAGSNPFAHESYASSFRASAPGSEYFERYVPEELADLCRKVITEYYLRLRDDYDKPTARYFAEKSNNLHAGSRAFSLSLFGHAKEIVIVRDPRDLLCSHMSYFQQNFGQAFRDVSYSCQDLLRIRKESRPGTMFVSYEKMILGQDGELARMGSFLGVPDLDRGNDEREAGDFKAHATSSSPAASIGRWQRQLSPENVARCNETWREMIDCFGYSS